MRRATAISVVVFWIGLATVSGQDSATRFDLAQRIPVSRHSAVGLDRLTESQIQALSAEVFSLIDQAYRRGQTGSSRDGQRAVAVIAPSFPTAGKAREILRKMKWTEVRPRKAMVVLVVVRSGLFMPLQINYDSFGELRRDADRQMNAAGRNFHIYLYLMNDDLRVTQDQYVLEDASDLDRREGTQLVWPEQMSDPAPY